MSSKTTVTPGPLTPEQKQFDEQQLALGQKQLDALTQQMQQQQDYLTSIKPAMDASAQLLTQQLQEAQAQNTPEAQALKAKQDALNAQQIQDQLDLAPLQKQALQAQLQQAIQGNNATPEQIAQIDAATQAAQASGMSDIQAGAKTSLQQLRDILAPQLGLRPTDTPIVDRGALVEQEATRQAGQLVSSLAAANANARLNYPLASQQISQATSQNAANITNAQQNFQAALAQAAATNRLNLLSSAGSATGTGLQSGLGLASASRPSGLSLAQGSTSTKSDPWGTVVGLVGGIGNALSGSFTL